MDRGLTEPGRERAPLDHRLARPGYSFGCFNGQGRLVIMSADEHERLKRPPLAQSPARTDHDSHDTIFRAFASERMRQSASPTFKPVKEWPLPNILFVGPGLACVLNASVMPMFVRSICSRYSLLPNIRILELTILKLILVLFFLYLLLLRISLFLVTSDSSEHDSFP